MIHILIFTLIPNLTPLNWTRTVNFFFKWPDAGRRSTWKKGGRVEWHFLQLFFHGIYSAVWILIRLINTWPGCRVSWEENGWGTIRWLASFQLRVPPSLCERGGKVFNHSSPTISVTYFNAALISPIPTHNPLIQNIPNFQRGGSDVPETHPKTNN